MHQQKITFVEKNLDALANIQKQLVDQNLNLKCEFDTAERKITSKDEQIKQLEGLLKDVQVRLDVQSLNLQSKDSSSSDFY